MTISENKQHNQQTLTNRLCPTSRLPVIDLPQTPLRPLWGKTPPRGPKSVPSPAECHPRSMSAESGSHQPTWQRVGQQKRGRGSTKSMKKHKWNLNFSSKNWKLMVWSMWVGIQARSARMESTTLQSPARLRRYSKGLLIHVRTGQGTWGCTPSSGSSNLRAALAVLKTWDPTQRSPGWVFLKLIDGYNTMMGKPVRRDTTPKIMAIGSTAPPHIRKPEVGMEMFDPNYSWFRSCSKIDQMVTWAVWKKPSYHLFIGWLRTEFPEWVIRTPN